MSVNTILQQISAHIYMWQKLCQSIVPFGSTSVTMIHAAKECRYKRTLRFLTNRKPVVTIYVVNVISVILTWYPINNAPVLYTHALLVSAQVFRQELLCISRYMYLSLARNVGHEYNAG